MDINKKETGRRERTRGRARAAPSPRARRQVPSAGSICCCVGAKGHGQKALSRQRPLLQVPPRCSGHGPGAQHSVLQGSCGAVLPPLLRESRRCGRQPPPLPPAGGAATKGPARERAEPSCWELLRPSLGSSELGLLERERLALVKVRPLLREKRGGDYARGTFSSGSDLMLFSLFSAFVPFLRHLTLLKVVCWTGAVLNAGIEWDCARPALNGTLCALLGCSVSKKDVHIVFPLCVSAGGFLLQTFPL